MIAPAQQRRRACAPTIDHGSATEQISSADHVVTGSAAALWGAGEAAVLAMEDFEAEAASIEEDANRDASLEMVQPLNSRRNWTNMGPQLAFYRHLERYPPSRNPLPTFRRKPVLALHSKLGVAASQTTLASMVAMRTIRVKVLGNAVASYPDDVLCTAQVMPS